MKSCDILNWSLKRVWSLKTGFTNLACTFEYSTSDLVEKYGPNFLFNDVLIFSIVQVLSVKPVLRGQLWDKEKVR